MNKKVLGLISLALIITLVGCSNSSSQEVDQLKEQVAQLTDENQKLKDQLEGTGAEAETAETAEATPSSESASTADTDQTTAAKLEAGTPVTIPDFAEVTLTKAEFTSKVIPSSPGSFYSYYEVKDTANIYLDTVLQVKSLLTSEKSADEFASVKVKYDNKYEYSSFSSIEDSGGTDLTYTNITDIEPLKNGTLHFIAELPKEASTDNKPIQIIVTMQNEDYIYTLR